MASLVPKAAGPRSAERNRELVLEARSRRRRGRWSVELPCPDEMIGSLAALPLPDGSPEPSVSALYADPLQETLLREHLIEVPIVPWPAPPRRLVRLSAQLYNDLSQYERLGRALRSALAL